MKLFRYYHNTFRQQYDKDLKKQRINTCVTECATVWRESRADKSRDTVRWPTEAGKWMSHCKITSLYKNCQQCDVAVCEPHLAAMLFLTDSHRTRTVAQFNVQMFTGSATLAIVKHLKVQSSRSGTAAQLADEIGFDLNCDFQQKRLEEPDRCIIRSTPAKVQIR